MFLNFECIVCSSQIQADDQHVGNWVECPLCSSVQVVPDIPLPLNSSFDNLHINDILCSDLFWTTYKATGISQFPNKDLLLRIPSTFFLNQISNLDAFVAEVIKHGALNQEEFPTLLEHPLVDDKISFVYDATESVMTIGDFITHRKSVNYNTIAKIIGNIATALNNVHQQNSLIHQKLSPNQILLTSKLDIRILDIGISDFILQDKKVLETGFNIWDYRYMSPEFLREIKPQSYRTDIYSLGAIYYYLLTGEEIFNDKTPEEILASPLPDPLEINFEIPSEHIKLINSMMAENSSERPDWQTVIDQVSLLYAKDNESSIDETDDTFNLQALRHGVFEPKGYATHSTKHIDKKILNGLKSPTDKKKNRAKQTKSLKLSTTKTNRYRPPQKTKGKIWMALILGVLLLTVIAASTYIVISIAEQPDENSRINSVQIKQTKKTGKSPQQSDRTASIPVEISPAKQAMLVMNTRIANVEKFYKENPLSYHEVIAKLETLLGDALDANMPSAMEKIRDTIVTLEREHDDKVRNVINNLKEQIAPLLRENKPIEAVELVKNYTGNDFAISADARKKMYLNILTKTLMGQVDKLCRNGKYTEARLILKNYNSNYAEEMKKRVNMLLANTNEEQKSSSHRMAPILKRTADYITNDSNPVNKTKLKQAIQKLENFITKRSLKGYFIDTELRNVKEFLVFKDTILAYFKKLEGKNIKIGIGNVPPSEITIKEVSKNRVNYIPALKDKPENQKKKKSKPPRVKYFKPNDIDIFCKTEIVDNLNLKDDTLLKAIIYIESRKPDMAEKQFQLNPLELASHFDGCITDIRAEEFLEKVLKTNKLSFDREKPERLLFLLTKIKLTSVEADKLLIGLLEFTEKYDKTRFAKKNDHVIYETKKFCKRAGAKTVIGTNISLQDAVEKTKGDLLAETLQATTPHAVIHLDRGVYKLKNGKAFSIYTKGVKLIASETGVVFKSPLKIENDSITISGLHFKTDNASIKANSVENLTITNCIFESYNNILKQLKKSYISNSLFTNGIILDNNKSLKIDHCTFTGKPYGDYASAPVWVLGKRVLIINSIILGEQFGIIFSHTNRKTKRKIYNTLLFGEKGISAMLQKDSNTKINTKTIAKKLRHLRRYCRSKKNIYADPKFTNPKEMDWSLVEGVPGYKAASDKLDCGVVWDKMKLDK